MIISLLYSPLETHYNMKVDFVRARLLDNEIKITSKMMKTRDVIVSVECNEDTH